MTAERFDFDKLAEEKLVLTFDFSNGLAIGETLTGVPAILVSMQRGKDLTPDAILNGNAQLDGSSKFVLLPVQGGVKGAEYLIRVVAPTSNALKVLALDAILPVV